MVPHWVLLAAGSRFGNHRPERCAWPWSHRAVSPSLRAQRGCAGSALCLSPLSSFSPSLSLLPAGPRHPGPQPGTVPLSSAALCPRRPPAVFCVPLGRHLRPRLVLECKASPTTEGSGRHPAFLHVPACGTIPSSAPACSAASWSLCPPSSVCPSAGPMTGGFGVAVLCHQALFASPMLAAGQCAPSYPRSPFVGPNRDKQTMLPQPPSAPALLRLRFVFGARPASR